MVGDNCDGAKEESMVETLESVERYLDTQEQLKSHLKAGIFSLAQARYSLGASRVGQMQYNLEKMHAATRVQCLHRDDVPNTGEAQEESGVMKGVRRIEHNHLIFQVIRDNGAKQCETGLSSSGRDAKVEDSGVVSRLEDPDETVGGNPDTCTANARSDKAKDPDEGERGGGVAEAGGSEAKSSADPVSWFGVLIPTSLRDAQQEFSQAVDTIIALANEVQRMRRAAAETALDREE